MVKKSGWAIGQNKKARMQLICHTGYSVTKKIPGQDRVINKLENVSVSHGCHSLSSYGPKPRT